MCSPIIRVDTQSEESTGISLPMLSIRPSLGQPDRSATTIFVQYRYLSIDMCLLTLYNYAVIGIVLLTQ